MTRQSDRSCFDFDHSGCSAALINSNWIELDEDRRESVRARAETRVPAPVPARFCPLLPADTEVVGFPGTMASGCNARVTHVDGEVPTAMTAPREVLLDLPHSLT